MTEDDARDLIGARHGFLAVDRLSRFLAIVIEENQRQNLIAPSTVDAIWRRHALDSVQLLAFDRQGETWMDVGTGGGFPGMVVALVRNAPVVMVEPRRRRATFLADCVDSLGLSHARVVSGKVERLTEPVGLISARAVASLDAVFTSAAQCAGKDTRWILPKGRSAELDLAEARLRWRGVFHVEHSLVEREAGIIVAERVQRR